MQQLLSSLEDERQRQFRRLVGGSALIHAALALLFVLGPVRRTGPVLPAVERVTLVEAVAPSARPAPARPAPARPKPPPPPAKKILPKEPAPAPKPKPVEAKPEPKPEPKPKPEPAVKPPEPAVEQDYEDVLEQLRSEAGEPKPTPVETATAAPAGGPVGGPGVLVDPATARWMREVKIHVTRAWILEQGFRTEALITEIEVDLAPNGDVLGIRQLKSSGNPWYDDSVERAIRKASPVPAPPEAGEWAFTFDSREMN